MPAAKRTEQPPEGAPETKEIHTDPASAAMRELGPKGNPLLTEDERKELFGVVVEHAKKGALNAAMYCLNHDEAERKESGRVGRPKKTEPEPEQPTGPRPVSLQDRLAERKRTGRPAKKA